MNKGHFKAKDYTGQRFGMLTVIKKTKKKFHDGSYFWKMKCDCGKTIEKYASKLSQSKRWGVYSCGCTLKPNSGQFKANDLSGYQNEMATIIGPTDERQECSGYVLWELKCECGKIFKRPSNMIKRGYTKSCGCKKWFVRKKWKYTDSTAHINNLFTKCKRSAKDRNLFFNLTKEECQNIFEMSCFYCGIEPKERKACRSLHGTYSWNGIDRIDSEKGYTIENVVSCCKICNFAKSDSTLDDFKSWIKRVHLHLFP